MRLTLPPPHRTVLLLLSSALVAAGCDSTQECLTDAECPVGQQCVSVPGTNTGACEPCAPSEVPYNGVDDDCNAATRDADLDDDGDNAINASFAPGTDCDDLDPTVAGGGRIEEVCGDARDNDCDGTVDEIDCGDRAAPTVAFTAPTEGQFIRGVVPIRLSARDDVGLTSLSVRVVGGPQLVSETLSGPSVEYETQLDTTTVVDNTYTLEATVRDVAGREGQARRSVIIENTAAPRIEIEPRDGRGVLGTFTIRARGIDSEGIAQLRLWLDDQEVADRPSESIEAVVTAADVEGTQHVVRAEATDSAGNVGTAAATIRVDTTGPTITIVEPPPGQPLSGPTQVTIRATDPSGVARISSLGRTITGGPADQTLTLTYTITSADLPATSRIEVTAVDAVYTDGGGANSATASQFVPSGSGTGVFDTDSVYLLGTLSPGSAGLDVVCNVLTPNRVQGGIDNNRATRIRPTDGALLYADRTIHQFVPDVLRQEAVSGRWIYPTQWRDNDPVITIPGCLDARNLAIHPRTGEVYAQCDSSRDWLSQTGTIVTSCGSYDLVLSEDDARSCSTSSIITADGTTIYLPQEVDDVFLRRYKPGGGFWLVDTDLSSSRPPRRWSVTAAGVATLDGTYAPWPGGLSPQLYDSKMDNQGNLYVTAFRTSTIDDVVVRFEGDFSSTQVVYDEANEPTCQMHISYLIGVD